MNFKLVSRMVVLAAVGFAALAGCGDDDPMADQGGKVQTDGGTQNTDSGSNTTPKNLVDTAVAAGSFNTLASLLTAAELVDTLKGPGPFTVLAPTDAAFAKLPAVVRENLTKPENKALLQQVLKFHVIAGKVESGTVATLGGKEATTLSGAVAVTVNGSEIKVGGATVTSVDVQASNGVIHVIDSVIVPAGAFDAVDTAILNGGFQSLVAAVRAADPAVLTALKGSGPLTVFAPTDAAFAPVLAANPDLLKPENKATLTQILTYHVLGARVDAAAAVAAAGSSVTTLQGGKIAVSVSGGKVVLNAGANQATVIATDVAAKNGIIHAIDKVLTLPPT